MDVKLVEQARNKDEEAYAKLIDLTSKKLYYTACTYVNDKDEAKNIVQDVYRNCFEKMYQLKDDSKFESWITVSVANKCRDYLRKNHKYDEVVVSDLNEEELDFEGNIEDERMEFKPDANFNYQELKEGLQGVLNELPEVQKMSIILVHLDGLKVKEAAAALQVPEGTVKSSISIGKQKIKNKIEELRKQNKSFYAVAPMPFLVWMLKEEMEKISVPAFVVHASTIQPPKIPKKEVAAKKAVTTTATKTAATTAFKAGTGKLIAGIVAVAIVGSVVGNAVVAKKMDSQVLSNGIAENLNDSKNEKEESKGKENDQSVFDSVLKKYEKYGTGAGTNDSSANWDMDTKESGLLSYLEVKKSASELGYAYEDLDEDGQDELVIGFLRDNSIYDIYTNKNGKAELLKYPLKGENADKETSTNSLYMNNTAHYWLGNGMIYTISVGSDTHSSVYKLKNNKLTLVQRTKIGVHDDGTNTYHKFNLKTNKFEEISMEESMKLTDEYSLDNMKIIELTPFGKKEETSKKRQSKKTETRTQENPQADENTSKADTVTSETNAVQGNNTYVMTGFNNQTISFGQYFVESSTENLGDAPYMQTVANREVQEAIVTNYKYVGPGQKNWAYNVYVCEIRYSSDAPAPPTMSQDKQDRYDISLSDGFDTREYRGTEDRYCYIESTHSEMTLTGRMTDFDIRYVDLNHPDVEYKISVESWSYGQEDGVSYKEDYEALGQHVEQIYNDLSPSLFAYVN